MEDGGGLSTSERAEEIDIGLLLRAYLAGFLSAALLSGLLFLFVGRPEPAPIVLHPPPTPKPTATPLPTATAAPLTIFVSGAVLEPGLYRLEPGARVGDALAAAGGVQPEVSLALVNQAQPLFDGAQVHVPEAEEGVDAVAEPLAGISGEAGDGFADSEGEGGGLIDVNRADLQTLTRLPGIGSSKAAAIIAGRPFASVEDLERVPGIGASTIEKLRPLITVQ